MTTIFSNIDHTLASTALVVALVAVALSGIIIYNQFQIKLMFDDINQDRLDSWKQLQILNEQDKSFLEISRLRGLQIDDLQKEINILKSELEK